MKPLYIFDLDGTLALIEHRRHHVEGPKKDWPAFFAACVDDKPAPRIIEIWDALVNNGADCWVWSGRSDEVAKETRDWLHAVGCISEVLTMRKAGDHQPDTKLKQSWLDAMNPEDRMRLRAVFDDRASVVQMWRDNGITCLQVAPGDF